MDNQKEILDKKTIKKIQEILAKQPKVIAAYLFGSAAWGQTHPKSDLDTGIVFEDEEGLSFGQLASIMGIVDQAVPDFKVDVRPLVKKSSPLFVFNVIKGGQPIYVKDEKARVRFEVAALKKFYDAQHIRDVFCSYLKKAVKEDAYGRGYKNG